MSMTDPADGRHDVICFSSIDWDLLWQGHHEIAVTLAARGHRVLFVENTGVRPPGLRDMPRLRQRIRNWRRGARGFRQDRENLVVYSPLLLPFPYSSMARRVNRALLLRALRSWTGPSGLGTPDRLDLPPHAPGPRSDPRTGSRAHRLLLRQRLRRELPGGATHHPQRDTSVRGGGPGVRQLGDAPGPRRPARATTSTCSRSGSTSGCSRRHARRPPSCRRISSRSSGRWWDTSEACTGGWIRTFWRRSPRGCPRRASSSWAPSRPRSPGWPGVRTCISSGRGRTRRCRATSGDSTWVWFPTAWLRTRPTSIPPS